VASGNSTERRAGISHGGRVRPFAHVRSIEEGLRLNPPEPFVVIDATEEFAPWNRSEVILGAMLDSHDLLRCYDTGGTEHHVEASILAQEWFGGSDTHLILDAHLATFLERIRKLPKGINPDELSPHLVRAPRHTPMHLDPPTSGGDWIFVVEGEKTWICVHPKRVEALFDKERLCARDPTFADLIELVGAESVRMHRQTAGEAIFLPPGYLHQVDTHRDAIGLAGVYRNEADRELADWTSNWLARYGLEWLWYPTSNPTDETTGVSHVAQNEYGLCLLATHDLDAGVVVAEFQGEVVPYETVPEDEIPYVLNLENGGWMIPSSTAAREANHSCDPNCTIDGQLRLVTFRPVAAGQELTYHYAMVDREHHDRSAESFFWDERWTFDCRCGAPNCMGRVDRYLFSDEA
jgi:hypothetical protein